LVDRIRAITNEHSSANGSACAEISLQVVGVEIDENYELKMSGNKK